MYVGRFFIDVGSHSLPLPTSVLSIFSFLFHIPPLPPPPTQRGKIHIFHITSPLTYAHGNVTARGEHISNHGLRAGNEKLGNDEGGMRIFRIVCLDRLDGPCFIERTVEGEREKEEWWENDRFPTWISKGFLSPAALCVCQEPIFGSDTN